MVLPQVIDAASEIGQAVRLLDPATGQEVELPLKRVHLGEGWVEAYDTVPCLPDDPLCIRFGDRPIMRRYRYPLALGAAFPTVRQVMDFDVADKRTGLLLASVRPRGVA